MKCRLFVFLLFLFSTAFGQIGTSLSLEESAVLQKFFEILFKESEAGYVLYNKKPVCIHGFYCKDPFRVNTSAHKQSVALREGARIWSKFNEKQSDITIHICEKEDPNIAGYFHVLVVNRSLLQDTVKNNLALFQYILGPSITPKSFVDTFLSNDQTYFSLIKEDKVLSGEILGFGTQNSIYGSRMEDVQEALEKDTPPFLPNSLIVKEYNQEYLPFSPSFGYASLKEELNDLQKKMTVSSESLTQKNPQFIFGCLIDSKKTKKLVSELESAQDKIQKLVKSSDFLEKILEKLTAEKHLLNTSQKFQFQFDKEIINLTVAKGLWESLKNYDYDYLPYFIKGMNQSESRHFKNERQAWFPWYRKEFLEGKESLQKCNDFFKSLDNDKSFQCAVPQRVYYKTSNAGYDSTECNGPSVILRFSIFSPLGHCLAHYENVCLNLKNTIPGFVHGIKGMKIGETREVFIHPSMAYGFDTSLEKCIHLKAIVTLLDIQDNTGFISKVDSIDLSFLMDSENLKRRNENYKEALLEKGLEIAKHLKKCSEIDLKLITDYLHDFYCNKEKNYTTTLAEQDLINQVHWNIYYGECQSN